MKVITATDFKQHVGSYLAESTDENIYITKNGKVISKLSPANAAPKHSFSEFFGTMNIPENLDIKKEYHQHLEEKYLGKKSVK